MNRKSLATLAYTVLSLLWQSRAQAASHLWWHLDGQKSAVYLYGEVTVIADAPNIYYAGANWHPGEPAGGYCGIQHNTGDERRTIFSIWDTTASLHPKITAAGPRTLDHRFGGEGEGGHTHMLWPWKVGETFQFMVHKQAGKDDTTDARYYVYDRQAKKWLHSATITSPNGGKPSVATIGGAIGSFLENFARKAGRDDITPKLALYRLWLGTSLDSMKALTGASGDGTWGQLHDAYFLAEGDSAKLAEVYAKAQAQYGSPVMGAKGKKLPPLSDTPMSKEVIAALKTVPDAPAVNK